jgi:hypothetical protein
MNSILSTIVGLVGLVSLAVAIYLWRKSRRTRGGDGDVPIVITGGSVELEFYHSHFPPDDPINPKTHTRQGKITGLAIVDNAKQGKRFVADVSAGTGTITFVCEIKNPPDSFKIELAGDGKIVTMDFDHGKLPVPNLNKNRNKHILAGYTITSMTSSFPCHIDDGTNATVSWPLNKLENHTIYIETK